MISGGRQYRGDLPDARLSSLVYRLATKGILVAICYAKRKSVWPLPAWKLGDGVSLDEVIDYISTRVMQHYLATTLHIKSVRVSLW